MYLLQRKAAPIGKGLGKTSGWVHRAALKAKGVEQVRGVNYDRIDDDGPAHHRHGRGAELATRGCSTSTTSSSAPARSRCARSADELRPRASTVHVIGGADVAAELDAKRAIRQGTELAARI